MFEDFGLGDIGAVSSDSGGMPSVENVDYGGYDAGALGQYADMSQGMPETFTGSYGQDYGAPGALMSALQGSQDYTSATAPSGGYSTQGLRFANGQNNPSPATVAPEKQNAFAKAAGMKATADGTATDWTDPKTIAQLLKVLSMGGGFISNLLNKGKVPNAQTAQQLSGQLRQDVNNAWNPIQAARANQFFSQQYVPTQQRAPFGPVASPMVASRGYAEGGDVPLPPPGGGDDGEQQGPLGLVATDGMGQADDVPVNLSGGEYVVPADVVSIQGDGNNAAGAKALDKWVQAMREQARSAPNDENPPQAQSLDESMGGQ
jgi:hypothetical protein